MTSRLRVRIVAMLVVFGALAGAASYVFGAPVSFGLLLPAMALVAAVTLTLGAPAAMVTALVAAAGFLYVQLAANIKPLAVDFGSGPVAFDLPTLLRGAGAVWVPSVLGVAALLLVLPLAGLVRRGLRSNQTAERTARNVLEQGTAVLFAAQAAGFRFTDEAGAILPAAEIIAARSAADESTGKSSSPQQVTFVRVSLGPNTPGGPDSRQRVTGKRLAEMVAAELGELRESAVVRSGENGEVILLLAGADEEGARLLVGRLEEMTRQRLGRTMKSTVIGLAAPGDTLEQADTSDAEVRLAGRPITRRVTT